MLYNKTWGAEDFDFPPQPLRDDDETPAPGEERSSMRRLPASGFLVLPFLACAPPATLNLLTRASEPEQSFLQERLQTFETKNDCVIHITNYTDPATLGPRLSARDSVPDLTEIPSEAAPFLIRSGAIAPLDLWVDAAAWREWRRDFFLTDSPQPGARHYLLPRFLETKVLVYSKSRVREAVAHWETQRTAIDTALRRYNGRGLPINYRLEANPAQWDFYDVFVAGWFWKTQEALGVKRGRLVCADGNPSEQALALWDRGFRLGADTASLARMRGLPVQQLFQWQAAFVQAGLCHPAAMGDGNTLPLIELFRKGEVFLAEVYPRDAWRLHGDETVRLPAAAPDPGDVGVCTLPRGVALQLNSEGLPVEESGAAATRIWWFAIPARASHPALAVKLASYLDAAKFQIEESAGFGLIPARKDLLADLSLLYGDDWTEAAFQAAAAQLLANGYTTGSWGPEFFDLADLYGAAYRQLCLGEKSRSSSEIAQALEQQFAPRASQILANPPGRQLSANP